MSKETKEILELKQQMPEDLAKASRPVKTKTITIVVDDAIDQVLERLEQELLQAFPGIRPSQADLVRNAVLRAGKGSLV